MKDLFAIIRSRNLMKRSQQELNILKKEPEPYRQGEFRLYPASLYVKGGTLFCVAASSTEKFLCIASETSLPGDFSGETYEEDGLRLKKAPLSKKNAAALRQAFPFTAPVSLRDKRTTIGCGDRLGLATAAHLRAVCKYDAYPVLAQQSIRELGYTGRDFEQVVTDAAFLVFQEGYEDGWGADGDHLKTIKDIDTALDAGMPMITLDLTEVLNPEAGTWEESRVSKEFNRLPEELRNYILFTYADRSFQIGNEQEISFSTLEAKRCTLMYWTALDFAGKVDGHIRSRRGRHYDLEISIDETSFPTLPCHHLFIIRELLEREVTVNSLAPRFIGEFQKAIDYIGDIEEFAQQFAVHCAIAAAYGNYKISVHSGSDKFSVYPAVGRHTKGRLHLKTAGTSWLEAVHTIAKAEPQLYRSLHKKAAAYFPEALKSYHITADISNLPDIDTLKDNELERYFTLSDGRQMLHITYGGLLQDEELRSPIFSALHRHEDLHYSLLQHHFEKHLETLGLRRIR